MPRIRTTQSPNPLILTRILKSERSDPPPILATLKPLPNSRIPSCGPSRIFTQRDSAGNARRALRGSSRGAKSRLKKATTTRSALRPGIRSRGLRKQIQRREVPILRNPESRSLQPASKFNLSWIPFQRSASKNLKRPLRPLTKRLKRPQHLKRSTAW